jgi:hypothetical protein
MTGGIIIQKEEDVKFRKSNSVRHSTCIRCIVLYSTGKQKFPGLVESHRS